MSAPTLGPAWLQQLAPDATLIASVLDVPVHGREAIIKVIQAAARLYERHTVVYAGSVEGRELVEYDAVIDGGVALHGVVTLSMNDAGQIVAVGVHHSPLGAVNRLAAALKEALAAEPGPEIFLEQ